MDPVKKLYSILAATLEIEESAISDEMSPDSIEAWDSFTALLLISELEKGFSVKFSAEEIRSVKNIGDIKQHLRNHGIAIPE